MNYIELGYIGLFAVSFLAATILPFSSELIFIGFLVAGFHPVGAITVATLGNFLGGLTNYGLGYLGNPKWLNKLGMNEQKIDSFKERVQKYGIWIGLITWLPFIGDPLAVACGYFRVKFISFSLLMLFGKFSRYLFLYFFFR